MKFDLKMNMKMDLKQIFALWLFCFYCILPCVTSVDVWDFFDGKAAVMDDSNQRQHLVYVKNNRLFFDEEIKSKTVSSIIELESLSIASSIDRRILFLLSRNTSSHVVSAYQLNRTKLLDPLWSRSIPLTVCSSLRGISNTYFSDVGLFCKQNNGSERFVFSLNNGSAWSFEEKPELIDILNPVLGFYSLSRGYSIVLRNGKIAYPFQQNSLISFSGSFIGYSYDSNINQFEISELPIEKISSYIEGKLGHSCGGWKSDEILDLRLEEPLVVLISIRDEEISILRATKQQNIMKHYCGKSSPIIGKSAVYFQSAPTPSPTPSSFQKLQKQLSSSSQGLVIFGGIMFWCICGCLFAFAYYIMHHNVRMKFESENYDSFLLSRQLCSQNAQIMRAVVEASRQRTGKLVIDLDKLAVRPVTSRPKEPEEVQAAKMQNIASSSSTIIASIADIIHSIQSSIQLMFSTSSLRSINSNSSKPRLFVDTAFNEDDIEITIPQPASSPMKSQMPPNNQQHLTSKVGLSGVLSPVAKQPSVASFSMPRTTLRSSFNEFQRSSVTRPKRTVGRNVERYDEGVSYTDIYDDSRYADEFEMTSPGQTRRSLSGGKRAQRRPSGDGSVRSYGSYSSHKQGDARHSSSGSEYGRISVNSRDMRPSQNFSDNEYNNDIEQISIEGSSNSRNNTPSKHRLTSNGTENFFAHRSASKMKMKPLESSVSFGSLKLHHEYS